MELRHLRFFVAAAEEEHFGRAATRLHLTRPAVSKIVADLEDELGAALFARENHGLRLSAAGRALLPEIKAVLGELDQAILTTRRIGQDRTTVLKIGYGSLTLHHPLFRAVVKAFHARCPHVTLSLREMPSSAQPEALAEGRIDAGFQHFSEQLGAPRSPRRRDEDDPAAAADPPCERLRLQRNGLGVIVPRDHRLARRRSVRLAELEQEPFVVIPHAAASPTYGHLLALCRKAGFDPRIVQEVHSMRTLCNLVSVGLGIGLSVYGKDFVFPMDLRVLHLSDVKYPTLFTLAWHRGRREPALDPFIDTVRACLKRQREHLHVRTALPAADGPPADGTWR